ncbi:hypothetical protein TOK_5121 [Pseudonocardia sp. N23]|nr:hypothetical protein TOK_5121 [Pseudonocardia sp. N23]
MCCEPRLPGDGRQPATASRSVRPAGRPSTSGTTGGPCEVLGLGFVLLVNGPLRLAVGPDVR